MFLLLESEFKWQLDYDAPELLPNIISILNDAVTHNYTFWTPLDFIFKIWL